MTPRVVRTVEELEALPVGSVVLENDTGPFLGIPTIPGVFHKFPEVVWEDGNSWFVVAGHGARPTSDIALPATILAPLSVTAEQVEAGKDAAEDALSTDCHIRETRHVGEYECDCPSTVTIDRIIRAALAAMGIPVEGGAE